MDDMTGLRTWVTRCMWPNIKECDKVRACIHAQVLCILRVFVFTSLHLLLMWFVSCLSSLLLSFFMLYLYRFRNQFSVAGGIFTLTNRRQMGLVHKEFLVVFHIRVPRETENHQRMKRTTQENPASNQSWITSEVGKVKDKKSSVTTGNKQTDDNRSTNLEANPATRARIPCLWEAWCKRSSCDDRRPSVCRNYKYENTCIHGSNCLEYWKSSIRKK